MREIELFGMYSGAVLPSAGEDKVYLKEACQYVYVVVVSAGLADWDNFDTAFEALLKDYEVTPEGYETDPASMDHCPPSEIIRYAAPDRCAVIDFVFDYSEPENYEQLVHEFAACTSGEWQPSEVSAVFEGNDCAIRIVDSAGQTDIPIEMLAEPLCESFEQTLRSHVESRVAKRKFLVTVSNAEAGLNAIHWVEDIFVAGFEARFRSLELMKKSHKIRVRNGTRVTHNEYGTGTVINYDPTQTTSSVHVQMDGNEDDVRSYSIESNELKLAD